jgi:hypothetical protein
MSQYILKKPTLDLGAIEIDIQHRLQRGKIKLLISHILFFVVTVSILFFAL